jgi:hypothetical protein
MYWRLPNLQNFMLKLKQRVFDQATQNEPCQIIF